MTLFRQYTAAPTRARPLPSPVTPRGDIARAGPTIRPSLAALSTGAPVIQRMKRKRSLEQAVHEDAPPIEKRKTETGTEMIYDDGRRSHEPDVQPEHALEGPPDNPHPSVDIPPQHQPTTEDVPPIEAHGTEPGTAMIVDGGRGSHEPNADPEPEPEGPQYGPEPSREMQAQRRLAGAVERQRGRMKKADEAETQGEPASEISKFFPKRGQGIARTGVTGLTKGPESPEGTFDKDTRIPVETPFGNAYVGQGMFKSPKMDRATYQPSADGQQYHMPYVKLRPDQWTTPTPKDDYDTWNENLAKSPQLGKTLGETLSWMSSTGPAQKSAIEQPESVKQVGATLATTSTVAEQHFTRNPDGGKLARAAFRSAHRQVTEKDKDDAPISEGDKSQIMKGIFNRKDGAFVPAWAKTGGAEVGGTSAYREMIEGKRSLPEKTVSMIETDMSDSSDDEL